MLLLLQIDDGWLRFVEPTEETMSNRIGLAWSIVEMGSTVAGTGQSLMLEKRIFCRKLKHKVVWESSFYTQHGLLIAGRFSMIPLAAISLYLLP